MKKLKLRENEIEKKNQMRTAVNITWQATQEEEKLFINYLKFSHEKFGA